MSRMRNWTYFSQTTTNKAQDLDSAADDILLTQRHQLLRPLQPQALPPVGGSVT